MSNEIVARPFFDFAAFGLVIWSHTSFCRSDS